MKAAIATIMVLILLACNKNGGKLYTFGCHGKMGICIGLPENDIDSTSKNTLFISKNNATPIDRQEIDKFRLNILFDNKKYDKELITQKVDSILKESAEVEAMNFLLSYIKGTDKERIEKAFQMVWDDAQFRITPDDSLYNALQQRYSAAQRDTIKYLFLDLQKNSALYDIVDALGYPKYKKGEITDETYFYMEKYHRVFAFAEYYAFEDNYKIINDITKNKSNIFKIYVLYFNQGYNGRHDRHEYLDIFTAYDFYKDTRLKESNFTK